MRAVRFDLGGKLFMWKLLFRPIFE